MTTVNRVRLEIRKAQAGAISNLRRIWAPECTCDAILYRGRNKHAPDCPRGDFDRDLRDLREATKPGRAR